MRCRPLPRSPNARSRLSIRDPEWRDAIVGDLPRSSITWPATSRPPLRAALVLGARRWASPRIAWPHAPPAESAGACARRPGAPGTAGGRVAMLWHDLGPRGARVRHQPALSATIVAACSRSALSRQRDHLRARRRHRPPAFPLSRCRARGRRRLRRAHQRSSIASRWRPATSSTGASRPPTSSIAWRRSSGGIRSSAATGRRNS